MAFTCQSDNLLPPPPPGLVSQVSCPRGVFCCNLNGYRIGWARTVGKLLAYDSSTFMEIKVYSFGDRIYSG